MKKPAKCPNILAVVSRAVRAGQIVFSQHASERMALRSIIKPEVEYVLLYGWHEAKKDAFNIDFYSWDYAIRGKTIDKRDLRIVVAEDFNGVLIITAIDLKRED